MVRGFETFKERFQGFEEQYVIIGGTACDLIMEREELDLSERKANGERVDSKNIKKHKNDVFRIAQLLSAQSRQELGAEVAEDMTAFLKAMQKEDVNLKSLGIRGATKERTLEVLHQCYELDYEL